ncbi:MAG: ATP-binding cassette domain-containing protein, partial [Hyphomicrobiales bacterium]
MADIKISNLIKAYGAVQILKNINLEITSGEFVVFVGPSGCGKSTLLRTISGLESITSGELQIDGQVVNEVPPSKRGIAMVFQSYALYPHMSVYENIAFTLENAGIPRDQIRQKVEKVAEMLQLTAMLTRLPKNLSGGQRQRVAIGRAIVRDPKVFLFDEPLSNLDAALRVQMRFEISRLKKSLPNTTMIYVTHDQVEAMTMADRIVVLRSGIVEQVGTPLDLYNRPDNLFVAGFIGSPQMNFIKTEIASATAKDVKVSVPGGGTVTVAAPG